MSLPSGAAEVMDGLTDVRFAVAGLTDPGLRRDQNEDSFDLAGELGVAVVSDGMGGAPAGEVASAMGVAIVSAALREAAKAGWADGGVEAAEATLREAISDAHDAIRRSGYEHPEQTGMGATLTALLAEPTTGVYVIGHVGDSRAYLLRRGLFTRLTRDDTILQEEVEQGRVPPTMVDNHPFGHILSQVLGMEQEVSPQILDGTFEPGDQMLLCSDGVTAVLSDQELGEMLSRGRPWPPETVVRTFIESVNARGGPDNATAILFRRT